MNFEDQAKKFMSEKTCRRSGSVRSNTLRVYRSQLDVNLVPFLGKMDLGSIDSATAKLLKERLQVANLKPSTINLAVRLMMRVVESATDERGNRLYTPNWNLDFIDLPKLIPATQKAPITPVKALSEAISRTNGESRALIALLGGTGLRIGEALALGVGPDWTGNLWEPEAGTVTVRATRTPDGIQPMPKTEAGRRTVDLVPALNTLLKTTFEGRTGQLFRIPQRTLYRRIHEQNIEGFHALRRRRVTHLLLSDVPKVLTNFLTGHAAGDITERYAKVGSEIAARKTWSEKAGLGFEL